MLICEFHSCFALVLWLTSSLYRGIQARTTPPWWDRHTTTVTYKPNPASKLTASYFFPYACTVTYCDKAFKKRYRLTPTWVSACTILTEHWVATSVDNFNDRTIDTSSDFYYHDVSKLQVNAGTIYGTPSPTAKGLRSIQKSDVEMFATLTNAGFIEGNKSEVFSVSGAPDPVKYNLYAAAARDSKGSFKWGVAFLKLKNGLKYSEYLLPAPQIAESSENIATKVNEFVSRLERGEADGKCVLAAWNRTTHVIGFFKLEYLRINSCRETYCTYDSRTCLDFPNPAQHVCFKSPDYGSDACPDDRGSAVFCKGFNSSILAILTTAPNCGTLSLPSVYTLMHHVVHAFGLVPSAEPIKKLTESELARYTLAPSELDN